jgi:hypothetical protein
VALLQQENERLKSAAAAAGEQGRQMEQAQAEVGHARSCPPEKKSPCIITMVQCKILGLDCRLIHVGCGAAGQPAAPGGSGAAAEK